MDDFKEIKVFKYNWLLNSRYDYKSNKIIYTIPYRVPNEYGNIGNNFKKYLTQLNLGYQDDSFISKDSFSDSEYSVLIKNDKSY